MFVLYVIEAFSRMPKQTPAASLLAFLLILLSSPTQAQISCDNDGIPVEFDERNGSVELGDVRVRQITGNRRDDRSIGLAGPGTQAPNFSGGVFTTNGLSASAFPDNGIGAAQINRRERNTWEADFPRGMYEFANENDLVVEFEVTVIGGQAEHINTGAASTVTLSIEDAGIDASWYGGNPRSLRQLRGDLRFRYSDLLQLATAGIHRANISLCVNVRGMI